MLTIVIGGNHEASNFFQELPYGGWIAPNIYYLGYAGVVNYNGLRIAGVSGIYKPYDYFKGHFEFPPYTGETMRSIYHYREQEIFRLYHLKEPVDVMLSHDWPTHVYQYGNVEQLLHENPRFRDEVEKNLLGGPPLYKLLKKMKPTHWFSAHLHVKFRSTFPHINGGATEFLALDKCLPDREYLQIMDIEPSNGNKMENPMLEYDSEWLSVLKSTKNLNSISAFGRPIPKDYKSPLFDSELQEENRKITLRNFGGHLVVPLNFERNVVPYDSTDDRESAYQADPVRNPQTTQFCQKLGIIDPLDLLGCFDR